MSPPLDNPWFISIAGGLIVALIVGALSRPVRPRLLQVLVSLALFLMIQVPICMFHSTTIGTHFVRVMSEPGFWLFFECLAVIIVARRMPRNLPTDETDEDS